MLKRTLAAVLAVSMLATVLAGCGTNNDNNGSSSTPNSSISSDTVSGDVLKAEVTLKSMFEAIDKEFGENGAIMMPMELDEQTLVDQYGLQKEDVEDFYGKYSMSMTNSDVLVAIKAAPGKVDTVKAALEKRKADLEAQYEQYPVNGSYDRAKASKVYTRGDYVFLIGVGVMPEDMDADPEFEKQVGHVQEVIDSMFE